MTTGSTQPFSCGGKDPVITADILEVIEIWKLFFRVRLVDDFRCCVRTFEESISLIEKTGSTQPLLRDRLNHFLVEEKIL